MLFCDFPLRTCYIPTLLPGLATIEASQRGLYGSIDFLGVDVLNKTVTRVLVEGDASGFEMHDTLTTLMRFKTTETDPEIYGQD